MTASSILLLPGLLCDEAIWQDQRAALGPERCIVPSYGHADSIREMARVALAAVSTPRICVAGHSMGGRVALEIASMAPERVERIALLDTGMNPLAPAEAGVREAEKRHALLQTAQRYGMRAMGEQWARGMVHPAHVEQPVFEEILRMIERKTPKVFGAQIKALLARPDARAVLSQLDCPTLILCGRQDAWSPESRHREMHALCAHSTLCMIEDIGHMTTMEQPAAVSQALLQWMAMTR
ncbi:MAG: 3-oxoadipate enol-lactonase 2 [Paracidovorax wautersii]|uniref:3-oxoadipate enol-lactonase 2 n=1 Tax=Paracidovorax wautersii TaxID=1177982 RepID=A0A7V8FS28_9BURK|nr:MAG: 3-oxoadipate enol-lactonase 2 [Paracidovorax wautersii]